MPLPIDHAGLEVLPFDSCLRLLAAVSIGRVGFVADGEVLVLPVNFVMDGQAVVFRTASGSKLAGAEDRSAVAFEADNYDDITQSGWSVLVSGDAHLVTGPAELEQVTALGISPWAGGERDTYVRLTAREITGRRIRAIE